MGIYKNLCEQLLLNQFVRIRSRQFLVAVVEKVINDNKKVSTQRFLQRDFLPCHFIKRNLITNHVLRVTAESMSFESHTLT